MHNRSGATSPSPHVAVRMYGAVGEHKDLPHKSLAATLPAPHRKSPFSPLRSTRSGLYSLKKIAGSIFRHARFVTQLEQYFVFHSHCCRSVFLQEVQILSSNSVGMWASAEQLVNSVTKGKLFAIKLLHLHECFSSPLDSTRCSSTAYLLHKLTHTHLQMGHSTCLLPESFRKLLLASPLQFPVGFSKRNEKSDFSMFKLQGMVFTLHRGKKKNALVRKSLEK